MSRWIVTGQDDRGTYYFENLDDEKECRWCINEVCCNADNKEMVAGFTWPGTCYAGKCLFFAPEPPDMVEALRKGVKSRA